MEELNAVTAGVGDVRAVIDRAKDRRSMTQQKTLLILDEIHRFNRAQQDALLPDVERGLITLIGLTTENPFFYVNSALLSRAQVFEFKPLSEEALQKILERALRDREKGLGDHPIDLDTDARDHFIRQANGDARRLLNGLELAALTTPMNAAGRQHVTLAVAEECVQKRALVHDKHGDAHYDIASAFIKSVRGSDPDAALYWMARLLAAGDDPRFIARRLIILASEDIGNADPRALVVAHAALGAVEFVGMPEGRIPLAQATVYLACASKSNTSYLALEKAMEEVEKGPPREVPNHLKDANLDRKTLGHGEGYKYPHSFPGHYIPQEYWPNPVELYTPGELGYETEMRKRLDEWRKKELMTKAELRKKFLKKRDALDPIARARDSAIIRHRIFHQVEWHDIQTLAVYVSFRSEVETQKLIREALAQKKRVVLPVVDLKRKEIDFCELHSFGDLAPGPYSIPEPAPGLRRTVDPADIEWVLVPGAAFDRQGGRIGMGEGYFDKLLARMPNAKRIGLAYSVQVQKKPLPLEPHDIRMNMIITEKEVITLHEDFVFWRHHRARGPRRTKPRLPALREKHQPDFIIANAENAAHGKGLTPRIADDLWGQGIDVLTMGNHTLDRKEILPIMGDPRLLRPANYAGTYPGHGSGVYTARSGQKIAVLQVMGRVYMPLTDCPFKTADKELETLRQETPVIFVDVHAEITSEKAALAWHLDGRVSGVAGTHTHIQTADERLLPGGTAF